MSPIPKVSVLIPTYNYAHYLDDAIQSVMDQTFTDFKLIIVDNCSTDNTDDVVKKYLSDNRVSFYKNKTNLGLVGNWNRCLDFATGEYIKFLCADDKFHPQQLERFVAVMDEHRDVSIISSYNEIFGGRSFCRMLPFKEKVESWLVREKLLGPWNWLYNPSVVMFRKADAEKIGRFDPHFLQFTDREYYLRLLSLGDCYVIPEVLCYVRSHENTQTVLIMKKKHERVFERYRLLESVKNTKTPEPDPIKIGIDAELKKRAVRCAAVLYEVLPKLYKKENRNLFKTAFQIGYSEGVLLMPLTTYLRWHYIVRLFGKKKEMSS